MLISLLLLELKLMLKFFLKILPCPNIFLQRVIVLNAFENFNWEGKSIWIALSNIKLTIGIEIYSPIAPSTDRLNAMSISSMFSCVWAAEKKARCIQGKSIWFKRKYSCNPASASSSWPIKSRGSFGILALAWIWNIEPIPVMQNG